MALTPNFSVTTTAQKVLTGRFGVRQLNFTNNNVGSGSVYWQVCDRGQATTLTTGNGNLVPSQPNPYELIMTPGYAQSPYDNRGFPLNTDDDTIGFDLYVISNGTANISVQTVPF
jgi:hypothetical protein